jgi:hypothetical protein
MDFEQQVDAVQPGARLRGVLAPVTRPLRVAEEISLVEPRAAAQVAFGCGDGHWCTFQIRGCQSGDLAHRIEPALVGAGVDIPLGASMAYSQWRTASDPAWLPRETRRCSRRAASRRTCALKRLRFSLKLAAIHRRGRRDCSGQNEK